MSESESDDKSDRKWIHKVPDITQEEQKRILEQMRVTLTQEQMDLWDPVQETKPQKHRTCWRIREELTECLLEMDCVKKHHIPVKDCLAGKVPEGVPAEPVLCQQLRHALFECKRSFFDMTRRFRGPRGGT